MVSWFAALFYMPRLYIYHVEAKEQEEGEVLKALEDRFKTMQKKLWHIIGIPAGILTVGFGVGMIVLQPYLLEQPWMHLKLFFVILLIGYHVMTGRVRQKLAKGLPVWSSMKLRLWNEVATILLIAIVFVVVLKDTLSWIWGVAGIVGIAGLLTFAIFTYKKRRERKGN